MAQAVAHFIGNEEVGGSSPLNSLEEKAAEALKNQGKCRFFAVSEFTVILRFWLNLI